MTAPRITYGHGFLTDCTATTEGGITWTEVLNNMVDADATLSSNGDVFTIEAKFDDPALDEYCYYQYSIPTHLSTNIYTTYVVRYKTSRSLAQGGAGARVQMYYTEGPSTELVLGGPTIADPPAFSTDWTVATGTLTPDSTLEMVRLWADDYPINATGTFYVYFDFLLICKGNFTFPNVAKGGVHLQLPRKTVELDIPGRDGGIIQNLGMKSPLITINGNMKSGETWGSTDYPYGEWFYKIARDPDPWQWLTTDRGNFKVTPDSSGFDFNQDDDIESILKYQLPFKVYSLSSLGDLTWADRQWYGK